MLIAWSERPSISNCAEELAGRRVCVVLCEDPIMLGSSMHLHIFENHAGQERYCLANMITLCIQPLMSTCTARYTLTKGQCERNKVSRNLLVSMNACHKNQRVAGSLVSSERGRMGKLLMQSACFIPFAKSQSNGQLRFAGLCSSSRCHHSAPACDAATCSF